eukprot:TRINITY_DN4815_c0_g1_i3.p1 TRINITY_DN4815_c0_g1~~TRINITY_DN4815_c0_g1_i3.p1  ORF type:complete len:565 (+),score=160.64 TRINITY_DN4815_c0_g1_i3:74-1768(+)
MWANTSLEELRLIQEEVARQKGVATMQNGKNLSLYLMSQLGELCEIMIWKDDNSFNECERLQIGEKLGDAAMTIIRLADVCGVDLGQVTKDRSLKVRARNPPARGEREEPRALTREQPQRTASPPTQQQQQQQQPKQDTYCPIFPPPHKNASPSAKPVSSPHRKLLPTTSATNLNSRRPGFTRTLSVVTNELKKGSAPKEVQKMFSPTHFDHNLFSPHCAETDFSVEYDKDAPLAQSQSGGSKKKDPKKNIGKYGLRNADSGSSNATHSTVWSVQPSPPVSPLTPVTLRNEFMPMIEAAAALSDDEWRDLDLTYCMPLGGKIVELKAGCRDVIVAPEDKFELLTLAREKYQEFMLQQVTPNNNKAQQLQQQQQQQTPPSLPQQQQQQAPQEEASPPEQQPQHLLPQNHSPPTAVKKKCPRRGITRTLSVRLPKTSWDADNEMQLYSPTHFSKDLFSPATRKTDFNVASEEDPALVPPAMRAMPEEISTPQHLHDNFDSVIENLEKLPFTEEEFNEMNVTFCVPYQGRTYDLLPNGQNIPVSQDRLPEFIALAKLKRTKLASGSA